MALKKKIYILAETKEKAKTIIDSTIDNGHLTEQEQLVLEKLREVEKQ